MCLCGSCRLLGTCALTYLSEWLVRQACYYSIKMINEQIGPRQAVYLFVPYQHSWSELGINYLSFDEKKGNSTRSRYIPQLYGFHNLTTLCPKTLTRLMNIAYSLFLLFLCLCFLILEWIKIKGWSWIVYSRIWSIWICVCILCACTRLHVCMCVCVCVTMGACLYACGCVWTLNVKVNINTCYLLYSYIVCLYCKCLFNLYINCIIYT